MELVVLTHNSLFLLLFHLVVSQGFSFNSVGSLTSILHTSFSYLLLLPPLFFCKMEPDKAQGKRRLNYKIEEEEEEGEEEDDDEEDHSSRPSVLVHGEDDRRKRVMMMNSTSTSSKKGSGAGGSTTTRPCCQAQGCNADLSDAKPYYRRHKVCDFHSKAPAVLVGGLQQRFCQQCSRCN